MTVFSFVLQDERGRINVTAWDGVANDIHDVIKVGGCVRLKMYRSKDAINVDPSYRVTDHDCELTLTKVRGSENLRWE